MFRKILIANRGEIAGRIIRTLKKMDIRSVTIYDEREKNAPYVNMSDESFSLGTGSLSQTFLNGRLLIEIAQKARCEAIHPGYGFLSENAEFARACSKAGIVFIGPDPTSIATMGNKLQALDISRNTGIPVIPGFSGSVDEILEQVTDDDFPFLVKASAGGGGKGMRIAHSKKELPSILKNTSTEAQKYFGDGKVYIEKYFPSPRHIEVQILGDKSGNIVHLFERECTLQRRYQKIIEEAPSITLDVAMREKLTGDAVNLAKAVNYVNAGTVEFLVDAAGNHYFIEMNTRIQVEHAVTEMITGIDLVEEQISIAAGKQLSVSQDQIKITGHAIEARVYAEDPRQDFRPSPGLVQLFNYPDHDYLRFDSDLNSSREILPEYDPMIAKMVIWGNDRNTTIDRLADAIGKTTIHGVRNNLVFLQNILNESDYRDNRISTQYVEKNSLRLSALSELNNEDTEILIIAGICCTLDHVPGISDRQLPLPIQYVGRWRINNTLSVFLNDKEFTVQLLDSTRSSLCLRLSDSEIKLESYSTDSNCIRFVHRNLEQKIWYSWKENSATLLLSTGTIYHSFVRKDFLHPAEVAENIRHIGEKNTKSNIAAPMNGKVIKINCAENASISKGDILLIIESMKMENEIRIPFSARVKKVSVREGDLIHEGQLLVEFV